MKQAQWPRPLLPGGTIGICSPAGPSPADSLPKAVAALEARGYKVKVAPNAAAVHPELPYLAGTDDQRVDDLNGLIRDPTVDLIMAARGGYGCAKLLDRVDYDALRADPKPLVGYSDITALSLAILAQANIISFSGLMATAGSAFGQDTLHPWSEARFFEAIARPNGFPFTLPAPDDAPWTVLRGPETVTGPLIPICLTLLESLSGTPYVPDLTGAILLIEDIHEELYAVDRCLTQLRLSGKMDGLKAVLIGSFNGVGDEETEFLVKGMPHIATSIVPSHVALATGVAYGHIARRLTLPMGAIATVDLSASTFTFPTPDA